MAALGDGAHEMTRARVIHHSEYLALSLLLIGAAIWQKDQITAWFWFWLFAPDIFGYLPAFLFGSRRRRDICRRARWGCTTSGTTSRSQRSCGSPCYSCSPGIRGRYWDGCCTSPGIARSASAFA